MIDRLNALWDLIEADRETAKRKIALEINKAKEELASEDGDLGPWETELLDYAGTAIEVNFLNLAIVSVHKAAMVNQLPKAEYDYGFNYGRRD